MKFEIVKCYSWYELVDNYGIHRIFGEHTNTPYLLVDDGEKDQRINLLPAMKKELKRVMGVA